MQMTFFAAFLLERLSAGCRRFWGGLVIVLGQSEDSVRYLRVDDFSIMDDWHRRFLTLSHVPSSEDAL